MRNIRDFHECPKCESEDLDLRYVEPCPEFEEEGNLIVVECNVCGYAEDVACADAPDPTEVPKDAA